MSEDVKILGTTEAWENGDLGESEEFATVLPEEFGSKVDEAVGLQMISVRLERSLIDDLKLIAKLEGIGYQPLMRRVLQRFATAELKQQAREYMERQIEEEEPTQPQGRKRA